MIFNTKLKYLILKSFLSDLGHDTTDDNLVNGTLVLYAGEMPTDYTAFESEWESKYHVSHHDDVTSYGENVLAYYGKLKSGGYDSEYISLEHDGDGDFTLKINAWSENYVKDGDVGFAVFYPWTKNYMYDLNSTTSTGENNYFICSVSGSTETETGLVQLDNKTIAGSVPVLTSFGFYMAVGEQ
jgi:hypothetical protein